MTKNQYAKINSGCSEKKDLSTTMKHLSVKKAYSKYSNSISHLVLSIVFISCIFISSMNTMDLGILKLYTLYLFLTISTSILYSNTSITTPSIRKYLFVNLICLKHVYLFSITTFTTFLSEEMNTVGLLWLGIFLFH